MNRKDKSITSIPDQDLIPTARAISSALMRSQLDSARRPGFVFYPGDFCSSAAVQAMQTLARGAHQQLMACAWESESQCSLSEDQIGLMKHAYEGSFRSLGMTKEAAKDAASDVFDEALLAWVKDGDEWWSLGLIRTWLGAIHAYLKHALRGKCKESLRERILAVLTSYPSYPKELDDSLNRLRIASRAEIDTASEPLSLLREEEEPPIVPHGGTSELQANEPASTESPTDSALVASSAVVLEGVVAIPRTPGHQKAKLGATYEAHWGVYLEGLREPFRGRKAWGPAGKSQTNFRKWISALKALGGDLDMLRDCIIGWRYHDPSWEDRWTKYNSFEGVIRAKNRDSQIEWARDPQTRPSSSSQLRRLPGGGLTTLGTTGCGAYTREQYAKIWDMEISPEKWEEMQTEVPW